MAKGKRRRAPVVCAETAPLDDAFVEEQAARLFRAHEEARVAIQPPAPVSAWRPPPASIAPADPVREQRIRVIPIDGRLLLDVMYALDGTRLLRCSGVPEDAVLTGIGRGYTATDITLYVASAAFEPLEPGQPPPEHPLTFDMRE